MLPPCSDPLPDRGPGSFGFPLQNTLGGFIQKLHLLTFGCVEPVRALCLCDSQGATSCCVLNGGTICLPYYPKSKWRHYPPTTLSKEHHSLSLSLQRTCVTKLNLLPLLTAITHIHFTLCLSYICFPSFLFLLKRQGTVAYGNICVNIWVNYYPETTCCQALAHPQTPLLRFLLYYKS